MCECRDCDNFKAKKIEPQVGDRVTNGNFKGILVALPSSGYVQRMYLSLEMCLVFWDDKQLESYQIGGLTVVE